MVPTSDAGMILPLVLVVTLILGAVIVAVAAYAATDLRYGQVVEARAKRIAAAQGAIDDALEQLSLPTPICPTSGVAGIDIPFPEPINGTTVVVNCRVAGTVLPPLDGWALVITGEGAPADSSKTLDIDNSSLVEIGGPVYLRDPSRANFKKVTQVVDGDLWHPDNACATTNPSDPGIQFQPSTVTINNLTYDSGRGAYCINRTWNQLFGTGPDVSPDVATMQANVAAYNPPWTPNGSCRVFQPGYYTVAPDLGSSNYFVSGNYVFDNVGLIVLHGKVATMGQNDHQGYPAVDNVACDPARNSDSTAGATLYTRGNTQIESQANSGFEISGRLQGTAIVSVHVLDSTLGYSTSLMTADNGNHKEVAMQGMVWAPYASVSYLTIPSDKAAILRGGAVLASFRGKVAASASGFLIEVATAESSTRLVLDSTATDSSTSTTVRAVVQYRPTSGELAVNSRRVLP
jgi:hypothetical protein